MFWISGQVSFDGESKSEAEKDESLGQFSGCVETGQQGAAKGCLKVERIHRGFASVAFLDNYEFICISYLC